MVLRLNKLRVNVNVVNLKVTLAMCELNERLVLALLLRDHVERVMLTLAEYILMPVLSDKLLTSWTTIGIWVAI
jgi:hypothetical protein